MAGNPFLCIISVHSLSVCVSECVCVLLSDLLLQVCKQFAALSVHHLDLSKNLHNCCSAAHLKHMQH